EMSQLPLPGAVDVRNVEIVEMLEVVGEIGHFPGVLIYVEGVNAARSRSDGRESVRHGIRAVDMRFALHTGREKNRARRQPAQIRGNRIEVFYGELRSGAARGACDVELGKLVS